jgi:hypothetical protein
VKERKLKKAQVYSILGFSIIALGALGQFFSKNKIFVYSLLLLGSFVCFFALIKAIKNFK